MIEYPTKNLTKKHRKQDSSELKKPATPDTENVWNDL